MLADDTPVEIPPRDHLILQQASHRLTFGERKGPLVTPSKRYSFTNSLVDQSFEADTIG